MKPFLLSLCFQDIPADLPDLQLPFLQEALLENNYRNTRWPNYQAIAAHFYVDFLKEKFEKLSFDSFFFETSEAVFENFPN